MPVKRLFGCNPATECKKDGCKKRSAYTLSVPRPSATPAPGTGPPASAPSALPLPKTGGEQASFSQVHVVLDHTIWSDPGVGADCLGRQVPRSVGSGRWL